MKEVTICISFSVKDGLAKHVSRSLDTMTGSYGAGIRNTESLNPALDIVFSLLKLAAFRSSKVSIYRPTLSEGRTTNHQDELEAKNNTHAKSDIIPDDHPNHFRGEF